jgi:hypothetical protein
MENHFHPRRATMPWAEKMKAAEAGDPVAEYRVAMTYMRTNTTEGMKWLQKAADHNEEEAQHDLALYYLNGLSVPPDFLKGIHYLQLAVDQGCPYAQCELAEVYSIGIGEPRNDRDTPVALLQKSVVANYPNAVHALAERYRVGLGVPQDCLKAIQLYQDCEYIETTYLKPGPKFPAVVEPDFEPTQPLNLDFVAFAEILSAYLKATEKQDAGAMYEIGKWLKVGHGMPRDPAQAYRWFNFAATHGHTAAASERDKLKPSLSNEDLARASEPLPAPKHQRIATQPTFMRPGIFPIPAPRSSK